jgi:hypothetical protein
MNTNQTSVGQDLNRKFNSAIAKCRYELENNLACIDVLDKGQLTNVLNVFNQRLLVLQHEFLELAATMQGFASDQTVDVGLSRPSQAKVADWAVGGITGGGGAYAASTVAVTTQTVGHLWWAKTVGLTLATVVAGPLGIPAATAALLIGAGGGLASARVANKLFLNMRRKRIRRKVMDAFTQKLEPKLRNWAQGRISE